MNSIKLLRKLCEITPSFNEHWSDGSLFAEKGKTLTAHGVFAEFSHFVRVHDADLTDEQYKEIGKFISDCMSGTDADLGNAAATCFIENLAKEAPSLKLKPYLTGPALKCFNEWNEISR